MKTTERPMVHEETDFRMGKAGRRAKGLGSITGQPDSARLSPLPLEWMDPNCWRLPSGKALAEFALEAGFLAPLMLGWPKVKRPVRHPVGSAQAEPAAAEPAPQQSVAAEEESVGKESSVRQR